MVYLVLVEDEGSGPRSLFHRVGDSPQRTIMARFGEKAWGKPSSTYRTRGGQDFILNTSKDIGMKELKKITHIDPMSVSNSITSVWAIFWSLVVCSEWLVSLVRHHQSSIGMGLELKILGLSTITLWFVSQILSRIYNAMSRVLGGISIEVEKW